VGVNLGRQRKPQFAEELDRAFTLYQALGNTEGQTEVLYQRGLILSSTDLAGARAVLEKARDMAHTIGSEPQEIAAMLQLGAVAYQSGDRDNAERDVTQGVDRARRGSMNYLAARGLADLGSVQFSKRDYTRAEASFRESLEIARHNLLRRAEARALFWMGNLHQTTGQAEAALQDVAPALTFYRDGGFQIEAVQCLLVMARAHRDLGHGGEAATSFEQALAAARQASDRLSALLAEQGLASVLFLYKHWPEAAKRYESATQSAAAMNDVNGVVRGLTGQAAALVRLGRFSEAETVLGDAEKAAEKAPARATLSVSILQDRVELALSRGRNLEAAALARRAYQDQAASSPLGNTLRCAAGVSLARAGQAAAGRVLCEPAVASLASSGDRLGTLEARLQLAEILQTAGQDSAALEACARVIDESAVLGDGETGWRAWALRARALRHRGDQEGAAQAVRKALQLYDGLGWEPAVLDGYRKRQEIAAWQRVLSGGADQQQSTIAGKGSKP
jgi:tetratricopeptide (TPR) repeat protein